MVEIFYAIPDSKYNEGIFLEEYNGQIQLIAGRAGKEGKNYKKWALPQIYDPATKQSKSGTKALPVSVNLGFRDEAIFTLEKILKELRGGTGEQRKTETNNEGEDLPF